MLKRDRRFVPEKQEINFANLVKVSAITVSVFCMFSTAVAGIYVLLNRSVDQELVMQIEPAREEWKKRADFKGGREFLNKGLEVNKVQAELFNAPTRERIILAPPPEEF